MLNKLKFGQCTLISVLAMGLIACSTTSEKEIAETFAAQRADVLKKTLPVHMDGYNLIGVKAESTKIVMTLLASGSSAVTPPMLSQSLMQNYCRDPEIHSLLEKGVSYDLVFRDPRGKVLYQSAIANKNCAQPSKTPMKKP